MILNLLLRWNGLRTLFDFALRFLPFTIALESIFQFFYKVEKNLFKKVKSIDVYSLGNRDLQQMRLIDVLETWTQPARATFRAFRSSWLSYLQFDAFSCSSCTIVLFDNNWKKNRKIKININRQKKKLFG